MHQRGRFRHHFHAEQAGVEDVRRRGRAAGGTEKVSKVKLPPLGVVSVNRTSATPSPSRPVPARRFTMANSLAGVRVASKV